MWEGFVKQEERDRSQWILEEVYKSFFHSGQVTRARYTHGPTSIDCLEYGVMIDGLVARSVALYQ